MAYLFIDEEQTLSNRLRSLEEQHFNKQLDVELGQVSNQDTESLEKELTVLNKQISHLKRKLKEGSASSADSKNKVKTAEKD